MTEQRHIQLVNELEKETTTINLGPAHPATHGIFQNILEVDGERIIKAEPTVGYTTEHLRNWLNTDHFIRSHQSQTVLITAHRHSITLDGT